MNDRETLQARIEAEAVAADDDQAAFETLARAHPHAAYATDPERFLAIGRALGLDIEAIQQRWARQFGGVAHEDITALLAGVARLRGLLELVETRTTPEMEGPMDLPEKIEAAIDEAVRRLFVNGGGALATRLELVNDTRPAIYLGSWSKGPAKFVIVDALRAEIGKLVSERDRDQANKAEQGRDALRADLDRTNEIALEVMRERDAALQREAALMEQLDRLIDWHKYQANSQGGIVQQIKDALRRTRAQEKPAGWTDQSPPAVEYRERQPLDLAGALADWEEPPAPTGEGLRGVPGTDDPPIGKAGHHQDGLANSRVVPPVDVMGELEEKADAFAAATIAAERDCGAESAVEYAFRDIRALVQGLVDRVAEAEETNRNNVAIAGLECKELYSRLRLSESKTSALRERVVAARAEGNREGRIAELEAVRDEMPQNDHTGRYADHWIKDRIAELEGGQADGVR